MKQLLTPLTLGLFLLSGCTTAQQNTFNCHLNSLTSSVREARWYRHSELVAPAGRQACAYLEFPKFNKLTIEGDFNVEIVKTCHKFDPIRIVGDRAFIPHIQARVVNNTLFIRLDPNFDYAIQRPIVLQIPYHQLEGLSYKGIGDVVLTKSNAKHFELNLEGNVNAWIKGNIALTHLTFKNNGKLVLYWINTKHLTVDVKKKGTVLLAGVAGTLEARVSDSATLDAKFLRVLQDAHVHTTQYSTADVTVLNHLNAFAEDNSTINYYQTPEFKGFTMHESGAILDMHNVYPPLPVELK